MIMKTYTVRIICVLMKILHIQTN